MSTKELTVKVKALRELQILIEEAETEAEGIRDQIKAHMGTQEELVAGEYKVRWATVKSSRFDTAALKTVNPELYNLFLKTTEARRFSVA